MPPVTVNIITVLMQRTTCDCQQRLYAIPAQDTVTIKFTPQWRPTTYASHQTLIIITIIINNNIITIYRPILATSTVTATVTTIIAT